jgi:flagellar assembly protein FliH
VSTRETDGTAGPGETVSSAIVVKQDVLASEYRRGYEAGMAAAQKELEQELERQLRVRAESTSKIIVAVQRQLAALFEQLEREAFRFALAVAERIVKREVSTDDDVVIRQLREAVHRVVGSESIKVRVHPADEALLREHRSEVLTSIDSIRELIIEADDKIERGGCIIESTSGNIDARWSTQLKQIDAALFGTGLTASGGNA